MIGILGYTALCVVTLILHIRIRHWFLASVGTVNQALLCLLAAILLPLLDINLIHAWWILGVSFILPTFFAYPLTPVLTPVMECVYSVYTRILLYGSAVGKTYVYADCLDSIIHLEQADQSPPNTVILKRFRELFESNPYILFSQVQACGKSVTRWVLIDLIELELNRTKEYDPKSELGPIVSDEEFRLFLKNLDEIELKRQAELDALLFRK